MRIGVVGNTNNYPLLLTEALRSLGHDADLFLLRQDQLHRPESRQTELSGAVGWVRDHSSIGFDDILFRTRLYCELLAAVKESRFDLLITNDYGPSIADELGARHVAMLTGSDLIYLADYGSVAMKSAVWSPDFRRSHLGRGYLRRDADFVTRQRMGILAADAVSFGHPGLIDVGDRLLADIGVTDDRRFMLRISDTTVLQPSSPAANDKLRILLGARPVWVRDVNPIFSDQDLKGTDLLLRGYADYVAGGGTGELCLVRKGPDVDATVALIAELGIASRVTWLEEMSLQAYRREVERADLVCDQFARSFPGMVTMDAYAQGRPVMANFRPEIFSRSGEEPFPGLQASTPEEIHDHLRSVDRRRDRLVTLGRESRAYAERNLSAANAAIALLKRLS